jgi:hypothetical protein
MRMALVLAVDCRIAPYKNGQNYKKQTAYGLLCVSRTYFVACGLKLEFP